ncbi:TetR family transcriptional regulator [Nocardia sp. NBC_00565]|uniref:TetR family transcriptional regulator n=1 Tax=Nocardia sp. NBC_00565 TaxID=2975993 RepID=UPI002E812B8F|nr:TetR family transcriptional regulator [Nocardia sp. NBC_00565]
MRRTFGRDASKQIIDVVLTLLETEGYDAVQLREVARRARVSLATVYKLFATRDELILAAIEQWMATNTYPDLARPIEGETLHDGLIRVLRHVFEPWERSPRMLEAFYRARSGPSGSRLDAQGLDAVLPVATEIFGGADPTYIADVGMVLTNMTYALIGRFVDKTLEITDILPTLERVMLRMTANNEPAARAAQNRGAVSRDLLAFLTAPYNRDPAVDSIDSDRSAAE